MSVQSRLCAGLTVTATVTVTVLFVSATPALAGESFPTLASDITQDLYGVVDSFLGGVAFANNGDPLVDACEYNGGSLYRFAAATTIPTVNGTSTLHSVSELPSAAGCGLTNHPDGSIYSNTNLGVVQLSGADGSVMSGPYGPPGDALGIATSPLSQSVVYVGSDGTLFQVNPSLTSNSVFSSALQGKFIDGIYFDPSGQYLFASDRTSDAVAVISSSGALVQEVPLGHEPDGIAFHTQGSSFVVTNNTDGTMSRLDFGSGFSSLAVVSPFASGGFRGDLGQVGPDGCLYITQDGTRYDDGTTGPSDSLVRMCPGFSPPAGVTPPSTLLLATSVDSRPIVPDPDTSAFVNLHVKIQYTDLTPVANATVSLSNSTAIFHTNAQGQLNLVERVDAVANADSSANVTVHATAPNGAAGFRSQTLYSVTTQVTCSFAGRPGIDTSMLSSMLPDPLGTIHEILQAIAGAVTKIHTEAQGFKIDVPTSSSFYAQHVHIANGAKVEYDGTGYSKKMILPTSGGILDSLQTGCTDSGIA